MNTDSIFTTEPPEQVRLGFGSQVGPYTVRWLLGRGGMGETYLADRRLGDGVRPQRVCLKRMLPGANAEALARFRREADTLLALRHVNVVHLVDYLEQGGTPAIAMEWVDGCDLRRLTAASRMQGSTVAYVASEVAQALEHAHGQGHLHRDLSPGNILLGHAGEVKVTDFGLARSVASTEQLTRVDHWCGKAGYAPPEVHESVAPTYAVDSYSLGAVIYECVSGRPAQQEPGDPSPRALAELVVGCPAELSDVARALLDPIPLRRPSPREVIERLEPLFRPGSARRDLSALVGRATSSEVPRAGQ